MKLLLAVAAVALGCLMAAFMTGLGWLSAAMFGNGANSSGLVIFTVVGFFVGALAAFINEESVMSAYTRLDARLSSRKRD